MLQVFLTPFCFFILLENYLYYLYNIDNAGQVRGKTCYIQYSNRQEIINSKTIGDSPSNVLLITLENLKVSQE